MEVTLSSRLKSLYSIYSKMKRKEVEIKKFYDARVLRLIIGDKNGTLHGQAVQSCYSLLNIKRYLANISSSKCRLWIPIDGEFDDYIINPKPSDYQSLHTALQGPDNSPLEVQIRTQRMHECAEHGLAAHWLYKKSDNKLVTVNGVDGSEMTASSSLSIDSEEQSTIKEHMYAIKG
ncbi:GTP pyrophosphokinase-like [Impatiens glandulifera]|uniref:GTP pyrophosphokinase-like n=1 Tax=Impatiens glandulifera TaxID=253017 RepID=UPI001FB050C8|nr:GTP pyrophosphokinase-like [Impatiens glandulifera]